MSKLTTKNYKAVKNYIAKHGVKKASTKYELGMSTIYLIKRFDDFDEYKRQVAVNSRRARERKEFITSFDTGEIIQLNDGSTQTSFTDDQKDYIVVLGMVLFAIIGLSYVVVRIVL